jgi:uncharacterized protein (TIGR03067 family)
MFLNSLVIALSLGFAADKDDKLQGTWQAEKIIGRGKEIPAERAKLISFVIEGNTVKRLVNGVDSKDPVTIKIDTSKKPIQFDLMSSKQGDPTMLGIYEIDGDTLKWCFSAKKRPEKFESGDGSDNMLIVMKRVKK